MLSKLAVRNAKRSIKDYVIYLITVTLSFSLIFAFNLISNSKQVLELNSIMENFKYAMYFASSFIILIVCFLINYTTKFMFQKRSKEFGTYELLGITKKDITKIFTLENIILGFFALLISIPIGYIFSILMSSIIMNIFELPELVKIDFGKTPILLSVLYFIIIYIFVLFLAKKRIKKMKIHDLLYFDKKNEEKVHKKKAHRNVIFIISLFMGIVALVLFRKQFVSVGKEPSIAIIFLSTILIIISIYGVTITLSDFILNFILKRKSLKYKGDNLFIARTFSSKVKSMSFTLGTITVLITLTLVVLNISSLFKGMFEYQIDLACPYDIAMEIDEGTADKFIDFIKEEYTIEEKIIYNGYEDKNNSIKNTLDYGWRDNDRVIKLSDFNKLLEMKGSKPISLKDDEYYLNVTKEYKEDIFKSSSKLKEITLSNGITLKQKEFSSEGYTFSWGAGYGYITVVPDIAVKDLDIIETHLIVNTKEKTTEEFARKLKKFYIIEFDDEFDSENKNEDGYDITYSIINLEVRGENEAMNKGFMTITAFVCFYLALIFTAVVGTILAIQSLSDSTQYKYRYNVLNKLGVRESELNKIIFKQLIVFFIFPLIYPVVVSFCTISSMNKIFQIALINEFIYLGYFFINLAIFLLIYIIYFLATYFGFKRNIEKG